MASSTRETLIKGWTQNIERTSKGPDTKKRSSKVRKRRRKAKRAEKSRERSRWTRGRLGVIGVAAAVTAVAAVLLFIGGNTSPDQQQTTQTTTQTSVKVTTLLGDVFRMRIFGLADLPGGDEWWLAFNITMTPSEEWRDVAVGPEVFFAQLTDTSFVVGQGVREPMTLQKAGEAVSVSKEDEFPTTRVQPGGTVGGLVLFLLPKDGSIARMFFHNGEVTADLPKPPT